MKAIAAIVLLGIMALVALTMTSCAHTIYVKECVEQGNDVWKCQEI